MKCDGSGCNVSIDATNGPGPFMHEGRALCWKCKVRACDGRCPRCLHQLASCPLNDRQWCDTCGWPSTDKLSNPLFAEAV